MKYNEILERQNREEEELVQRMARDQEMLAIRHSAQQGAKR